MLGGWGGGGYGKAGGAGQEEQNKLRIGLDIPSPILMEEFRIE